MTTAADTTVSAIQATLDRIAGDVAAVDAWLLELAEAGTLSPVDYERCMRLALSARNAVALLAIEIHHIDNRPEAT